MNKYYLISIIFLTLLLQGFVNAQDQPEELTTIQKVRELILELVPDAAGLEATNNKIDSVNSVLDTVKIVVNNFEAGVINNVDSLNDLPGAAYMLKNDSTIFASRYYTDGQLLTKANQSHNHSGVYEPIISKETGYLRYNGTSWGFLNDTYVTTTETSTWDKTASDDFVKSDTVLTLATQTDIAAKLNANIGTYSAYTTPTNADIVVVQKEGSTDLAKVELAAFPMSTETSTRVVGIETVSGETELVQALNHLTNSVNSLVTTVNSNDAYYKSEIERLERLIGGTQQNTLYAPVISLLSYTYTSATINITTTGELDSVYLYYTATMAGGITPTVIAVDSGIIQYTITGLDLSSTTYEIYAKAKRDESLSVSSNILTTILLIKIPLAPTAPTLFASNDTSGVKLYWVDNSDNEDGFYVWRSYGSVPLTLIDTLAANTLEYCNDTKSLISGNTNFSYQVYAYNSVGQSGSHIVTATAYYVVTDTTIDEITSTGSEAGIVFDAEDGNLSDFEATSITDSLYTIAEAKLHGSLGYKYRSNGSSGVNYASYSYDNDTICVRAYIWLPSTNYPYYSTATLNYWDFIRIRGDIGFGAWRNLLAVNLRSNNANMNASRILYWNGTAQVTKMPALAHAFALDDTSMIELRAYIGSGGTGKIQVYINDVLWDSVNTLSNTGLTDLQVEVGMQGVTAANGEYFYFDDIKIAPAPIGVYSGGGDADTTFIYTYADFHCESEITVPSQVTGLDTVLATANYIRMDWTDLDNEDGYLIQRKLATAPSSSFVVVGNTAQDINQYTDYGLSANTLYTYRVAGINAGGTGTYSDTLRATTRELSSVGSIISADYYFDSVNGNDNNNGSTPTTAWRSVSKFNSTNFPAGTIIAFRDSMDYYANTSSSLVGFRIYENGTTGSPITITNWYGAASDSFPRFNGSLVCENEWTPTAGYTNIWQTTLARNIAGYINAVWVTYAADSIRWVAVRQAGIGALTHEFECYGNNNNILYIYSPEDPDTRYKQVNYNAYDNNFSPGSFTMHLTGDYIDLQYLDFKFGVYEGLRVDNNADHINIYDCNGYYNGYSWFYGADNVLGGDNGSAIELNGADYVTVKRCSFYENSSHGFYTYASGGRITSNITIDSCLSYNNHHTLGFDLNTYQAGSTIRDVKIRWNKVIETAYYPYRLDNPSDYSPGTFLAAQYSSTGLRNILLANNFLYGGDPCIQTDVTSNTFAAIDSMYIYNNTMVHRRSDINYCWYGTMPQPEFKFHNNILYTSNDYRPQQLDIRTGVPQGNIFYRDDNNADVMYNPEGGNVPTPGNLRANPLFVNGAIIYNPSNINAVDYSLQSGSPAVGYGNNLGTTNDINIDINGEARTTSWDAGCYQYVAP